ncbi:type II secretion system minor pseudopilin GspK [Cupriavidus sp. SZY C1]|uniref:type II secretion system minor pseudopilin GspK n=1 Tax=Cupriavidus sp. SZY C1 TaxID=3055037 RepID=UPI0028BBEE25|nr:type II secretion system minor pseudopilin GspK [Cupriavidus sp. SZY C1]MDT6964277.1 type II secretion system minor pseudopilin GspK [Cupriavidus sp. SZY C1]
MAVRTGIVMPRQRGAAVVTALLVVALCVTLVTTMFVQQQTSTRAVESRRLRAQGEAMQDAITAWAVAVVQESGTQSSIDHLRQRWAEPRPPAPLAAWIGAAAASHATLSGAGDIEVGAEIEDAQGRFNLMTLVTAASLTEPPGVSPVGVQAYRRLLASLSLDTSLAAPTADYILRTLRPDGPLPLLRAADLRAVRGYTPQAVARLAPFVVALPEPTSLNINTAGPELLAAFVPGLTVSQASTLIADRDRAYWRGVSDLSLRAAAMTPAGGELQGLMLDAGSHYFIVHGTVRSGRAVRRVQALLYRSGIGVAVRTRVLWVREPDDAAP